MVGATGFEPATTCTPIETGDRPTVGSRLQPLVNNQTCASPAVQTSQGLASFSQNFAATLLLGQAASETLSVPIADPERLLTVGQVAKLLQVCNATVYKLCEKGELEHTRILNSIRIARADLSHLIDRRSKALR